MDPSGLTTLHEAIGRRMREIRVDLGLSRSELALWAREQGVPWTERIVGQNERGHRQLPLDEFLRLPLIYTVGLETFFQGDEWLRLDEQTTAQTEGLRLLLTGRTDDLKPCGHMSTPLCRRLLEDAEVAMTPVPDTIEDAEATATPVPETFRDLNPADRSEAPAAVAPVAEGREAERRAATSLGISAQELVERAHQLWGNSLVEERETRLKNAGDSVPDLRTARGHVTRELVGELRADLEGAPR